MAFVLVEVWAAEALTFAAAALEERAPRKIVTVWLRALATKCCRRRLKVELEISIAASALLLRPPKRTAQQQQQ